MKIYEEIELSDELDSDGELEIFITLYDIDHSIWIDQEKVVEIIEHLSNFIWSKAMKKFTWGKVIDRFDYDFDGMQMSVVKFHPWVSHGGTILTGNPCLDIVSYHCEELHESSDNLLKLVIAWIAFKKLGLNERSLVAGISRALCLE